MEYIEREAAIMAFHDKYGALCSQDALFAILVTLKDVPAADVVTRDCYDRLLAENDELRKERPVRHGRWIVSRTDYGWNGAEFPTHCKCGQCGREVPYQDRDNYCPTCGALMDKDGDGE